jgi:hypothetical protein
MARPQLNPKQRKWLNNFLAEHPYYKLKEVRAGLDGDRIVRLEGYEQLPLPVMPEFAAALPGYRWHTVEVKLRKFGDARYTSKHKFITVYPHCHIGDKRTTVERVGQLSLPIPAAVLAVAQPINPVIVTWKPKQKTKPKQGIQLNLPVAGLEAELFRLRQQKRPHLPPVSSQDLLAEKVSVWNQRYREEAEIPQVLVDLLIAQTADDEEWQSAIDLYQIIGLSGAMEYVRSIPAVRQHFGKAISTAAASAAVVPAQTKVKPTSVALKVFS